jgi:hypothetical protein
MVDLRQKTMDELSLLMPGFDPTDIHRHEVVLAEFSRRQLITQIEAANAQRVAAIAEERAADATVEAAGHAGRNAKYMLWSVIMAASSAFISLVSTVYINWPKH